MQAGHQNGHPHRHAHQRVGQRAIDAHAVEDHQQREQRGRRSQGRRRDVLGIEQREHKDGANVIGNGQRGDEHGEGDRRLAAEHCKQRQCERRVGRHRHAPAAAGRT